MHQATLGVLSAYPDVDDWLVSAPVTLDALGGETIRFVFDDARIAGRADVDAAIRRLLGSGPALLDEAGPHVTAYCEDFLPWLDEEERANLRIDRPDDIWDHVYWPDECHVSVREDGDEEDGIYFSFACGCDWEPEHGLQIVVRDGVTVNKVGGFDGHLTNTDAYGSAQMRGVVYRSMNSPLAASRCPSASPNSAASAES